MTKRIFLFIIMLLFIGTVAWQFMMHGTSFRVEAYPDEHGRSSFFSNNPVSRALKFELELRSPFKLSEPAVKRNQEVAHLYLDYLPQGKSKMLYNSCAIMASDLKPEKNGCYMIRNPFLHDMLKQ